MVLLLILIYAVFYTMYIIQKKKFRTLLLNFNPTPVEADIYEDK